MEDSRQGNPIELKNTIIDQMRQAYSKTDSYIFSVSDSKSDFRVTLGDIINLNPILDYEIALIRLEAYNYLYNITTLNNNFRYFNGTAWKTITLAASAY